MKKSLLSAVMFFATSLSSSVFAGICDSSKVEFLNRSNQPLTVSEAIADNNSTISYTDAVIAPGASMTFTVNSGKGTRGAATGHITLIYENIYPSAKFAPSDKKVTATYSFTQKLNGKKKFYGTFCHPEVTIKNIQSSEYLAFPQNNSPGKISIILF